MKSGDMNAARINRAYDAISKYLKSKQESIENDTDKKNMLLADDEEELQSKLQLIFVNNKSFTGSNNKLQFKPLALPVAHSLYSKMSENSDEMINDFKILLILNDKHGINVDEDDESSVVYKLKTEDKIPIDKVIVGKDLKTTYKAYEKRRQFLNDYQLILCDDSIVTTMPKLMGGKFYNKLATTPVPIKVSSSSTTLYNSVKKFYLERIPCKIPRGTTLNLQLGDFNWWTKKELVENVQKLSESIISKYNIRSIFMKTNFSPVLPLYFNEKSIDVFFDELKEHKETLEKSKADSTGTTSVEIDGVDIELNVFNQALMEIANPDELNVLFKKQITNSKKRKAEEEEQKEEQKEEPATKKTTKKAKK